MDLTTLLFLILLSILLAKSNPIMANIFLLLGGLLSATGITTNQIASISGETITYVTIDPLISYAVMLVLVTIAFVNYLDLIDKRKTEKESEY
jgi:hypothetical protein